MDVQEAKAEGRVRRRGGPGPRGTGPSLAPVPRRLENIWEPLRVLTDEAVEAILDAAYRILEEGGVEFRSARAVDVLRQAGVAASLDEPVRLPREVVQHWCGLTPREFALHSRNPDKTVHVGGRVINFCTANGAPNVSDRLRGRRYGDYAALCEIIRINNALGAVHISGAEVTEPTDVPVALRPVRMAYAHIANGDLVWAARGIGRPAVHDAVRMACLSRGLDEDGLAASPSFFIVTNSNSPRRMDEELLEGAIAAAEHGQAVCATPFTLAGAMAPITLAGALALQTAEAMAVIALVQMVRPGSPVIYGGFTSNVDMRSGSPAFGTPEYVRAVLAGGQIARRLGLPYRTSGPNSSTSVDAQAAYETQFPLFAAIMAHGNVVIHSSGWLESGLTASYEKIVIDTEMLRGWAESMKPIDARPEDLAVEAVLEVPPGGHFFGSSHTMTRFETAFHAPLVSDWTNWETWRERGSKEAPERATEIWQRVLRDYVPPPLDPSVDEALRDYIARRTAEETPG